MLRAAQRAMVVSILDESYFGRECFTIQFGGSSDYLFDITYLPNTDFSFAASILDAAGKRYFKTRETPGIKFLTPESRGTESFDTVLSHIGSWTERIREEVIASSPFARDLSELRQSLLSKIEAIDTDLDDFFTLEEAQVLETRLTEMSARLDDLASSNSELASQVAELKATLQNLQDCTSTVTRGTWYRMSAGKILSSLRKVAGSKEAREFALEAAKKFLLEGPK